jgi:Arm DNA-binding domain
MPLNDLAIRNAKHLAKPYKLSDEKGLFLLIHPNGSKYWRFKYYFAKKEKLLALGVYPEIKLSEARDNRDKARKLLDAHIDPGEAKKTSKNMLLLSAENSFEVIAREWHLKFLPTWTEDHAKRIITHLENDIFPWLGTRNIGYTNDEITSHSFRSMASTLLNEQGWNRDAIERQLAHGERNKVRASYNYAEYLPERKKMMQSWADYLEALKKG